MFSLEKTTDTWTLRSRTTPLRRVLFCGAGLAGLAVGAFESKGSAALIALSVVLAIAVVVYAFLSEPDTTTRIDLTGMRVVVEGSGPFRGAVKSFDFSEIAAFQEHKISGETKDSWEARIELRSGATIKLGSEIEGRDEHIRAFLDEIRTATGIGGTRWSAA